MITRLPSWVLVAAALLAAIAGMLNVVALFSFEQQAITHLTGTLSLFGAALVHGEPGRAWHYLATIAAFCLGAVLSGAIVQDSTLRLGRRYGVVLFLESSLLLLAVPLLYRHNAWGLYLMGVACGLQNAMATTYSGAVVRTSHVTGMFTDLGVAFGHWMRGMHVESKRLQLCVGVIGGFLLGSIGGAFAFAGFGYASLYFPAALTGGIGISHFIYRWRRLHRRAHPGN